LYVSVLRVSLSTLREVIRLNDLTTVEQITDYTKQGHFVNHVFALEDMRQKISI